MTVTGCAARASRLLELACQIATPTISDSTGFDSSGFVQKVRRKRRDLKTEKATQ